jgi:hypothetical protein
MYSSGLSPSCRSGRGCDGDLLFGVDLSTSGHKYVCVNAESRTGVTAGLALQAPNGGAEYP